MGDLLRPWRRYFDFNGRSRRTEYGVFLIVFWTVTCLILGGILALATIVDDPHFFRFVARMALAAWLVFVLVALIPSIALSVRRFHDQDLSGLWLLVGIVPIAAIVICVMLLFVRGTPGANRFGADPRGPDIGRMAGIFS
jgi:uncharacterized membrane protein YhaH (DUF805 family)